MTDSLERQSLDASEIGDVAATVNTLAALHRVSADPEPIDGFADAAARLCDADMAFDRTERLLIALARAEVITDEQRFAWHAAHLHQKHDGLRSVR